MRDLYISAPGFGAEKPSPTHRFGQAKNDADFDRPEIPAVEATGMVVRNHPDVFCGNPILANRYPGRLSLCDAFRSFDPLSIDRNALIADADAIARERHDRLDLLINNAGVMIPPAGKTEQGLELQFGVQSTRTRNEGPSSIAGAIATMTGVFFALALVFSPTHGILFRKVKATSEALESR